MGHIFRDKSPFTLPPHFAIYNKLLILKTLCSHEFEKIVKSYIPYSVHLEFAEMLLEQNQEYINNLKSYYKNTFKHSIDEYFQEFNIPDVGCLSQMSNFSRNSTYIIASLTRH